MSRELDFDECLREIAVMAGFDTPCSDSYRDVYGYLTDTRYNSKDRGYRLPFVGDLAWALRKELGHSYEDAINIICDLPFAADQLIAELLGLDELVAKRYPTKLVKPKSSASKKKRRSA